MTTYTVHAPTGDALADARADRLVFVPERASWAAFLFPWGWAPFNRLWLVLAGWAATVVLIELTIGRVSAEMASLASLGFAVWFGLAANDLRRWTLERRGARFVGLVEARDEDEAVVRFATHLADPARPHFGDVVEHTAPSPAAPAGDRPIPTPDLPTVVGWGSIAEDKK